MRSLVEQRDQQDGRPIVKSSHLRLISPFLSRVVLLVAISSLPTACKVPADPESTTQEVTRSKLKVGALINPLDDVETRAVARVADALQANVDLVVGDPHSLFALLEKGELHLIAGRIPSNTPFASDVGLTDPIGQVTVGDDTEDRVLAIRRGENRFLTTANRAIRAISR